MKAEAPVKTADKNGGAKSKSSSPYMSRGIYKNYAKGMKEKNQKRAAQGLEAIYIRTFEEWSNIP